MLRPAILQSLKVRFGPCRWLGIGAFCLLLLAWRFLNGEVLLDQKAAHFAYIGLGLAYVYGFSPIPWQWTGDGRWMPSLGRGLLQALVWNGFWLFFFIALPVSIGDPSALLGREAAVRVGLPAHAGRVDLARVIFSHSFWTACLVGWFIAREEATRAARQQAEAIRCSLENAARQAQVQALQAQLDPHVLHNALSGISELIHEDTAKAEAALVHLSGLYRKLTALGKRASVRLAEERQVLEDYLAVEYVRLGPRLQVAWEWPEALNGHRVPPLLIQPLVENAIKHGVSPEEGGGRLFISLSALSADLLRIRVANTGRRLDPGWREGTGLSNLSARLALIGGGSGLALRREGELTIADLHVRSGERA